MWSSGAHEAYAYHDDSDDNEDSGNARQSGRRATYRQNADSSRDHKNAQPYEEQPRAEATLWSWRSARALALGSPAGSSSSHLKNLELDRHRRWPSGDIGDS